MIKSVASSSQRASSESLTGKSRGEENGSSAAMRQKLTDRHLKMISIILVTKWHNHTQRDPLPSYCGYSRGEKAPTFGKLLEKKKKMLDEACFSPEFI